ncbi:hypothetical protein [Nocardia sp. AG03]|uniref:hypothetical protein n=1 Tax=Nocardia sp. AG03 TaxID=3025312 RepID=UPI002418804E|nr:hypothetical protein [Nocardia sp. AG03]
MNTALLLSCWRVVRLPVLLGTAYLVLTVIVAALSARHGFGSPGGLSPAYVIAVGALLVLRVVLLVVVPSVLLYRAVMWLVDRPLRRPDTVISGGAEAARPGCRDRCPAAEQRAPGSR